MARMARRAAERNLPAILDQTPGWRAGNVLDVRPRRDFAAGHLAGAVSDDDRIAGVIIQSTSHLRPEHGIEDALEDSPVGQLETTSPGVAEPFEVVGIRPHDPITSVGVSE